MLREMQELTRVFLFDLKYLLYSFCLELAVDADPGWGLEGKSAGSCLADQSHLGALHSSLWEDLSPRAMPVGLG